LLIPSCIIIVILIIVPAIILIVVLIAAAVVLIIVVLTVTTIVIAILWVVVPIGVALVTILLNSRGLWSHMDRTWTDGALHRLLRLDSQGGGPCSLGRVGVHHGVLMWRNSGRQPIVSGQAASPAEGA
jgi:hypothetical protein